MRGGINEATGLLLEFVRDYPDECRQVGEYADFSVHTGNFQPLAKHLTAVYCNHYGVGPEDTELGDVDWESAAWRIYYKELS